MKYALSLHEADDNEYESDEIGQDQFMEAVGSGIIKVDGTLYRLRDIQAPESGPRASDYSMTAHFIESSGIVYIEQEPVAVFDTESEDPDDARDKRDDPAVQLELPESGDALLE